MNKKILSAAMVAGFVLPFAAHADVKVYGAAQAELVSYSDESDVASPVDLGSAGSELGTPSDTLEEEDNARGRIGVKASEDLGGGLKGIAKFEWKTDTTVGGGLGAREMMVGLKGGFGTLQLGDLKSPYKYNGGVKYDAFVTTSLEARGNGGMSGKMGLNKAYGHHAFVDKSIRYDTPKVNGLQGQLLFRLAEGGSVGGVSNEEDGGYIVAVNYNQGPIEVFVAAGDDDQTQGGGESYSMMKLGGAYKAGPLKLMLQYEAISNTADIDETVIYLAGQYKMGKNVIVLQIAQNDVDDPGDVDAMTYMALGLIHKFTKSTRIWVGYRSSSDAETAVSVGLRKDFSQ